jgi:hypothetical protein
MFCELANVLLPISSRLRLAKARQYRVSCAPRGIAKGRARAVSLLMWYGEVCGVPFSLRDNGHELLGFLDAYREAALNRKLCTNSVFCSGGFKPRYDNWVLAGLQAKSRVVQRCPKAPPYF